MRKLCSIATNLAAPFVVSGFCCSCCDRVTQSEKYSPSKDKVARVTIVNCGALADYATQVDLRDAKALFLPKSDLVIGTEGRHSITLEWKDDHTLIVYLPDTALPRDFADRKIDSQKSEVDGVHIDYRY